MRRTTRTLSRLSSASRFEAQRQVRRSRAPWAYLLCCMLLAFCNSQQSSMERTSALVRDVRATVLEFRAVHQAFPSKLGDLCKVSSRNCSVDSLFSARDAWGRSLSYRTTEHGYEIRSTGADGLEYTADDVVLSSETEHAWVSGLAGCYEFSGTVWANLDSTVASLIAVSRVRLDTVISDHRGHGWSVSPAPRAYKNGRSGWFPLGPDSLQILWTVGFTNERLILRRERDLLVGRWYVGDDTDADRLTGAALLKRRNCDVLDSVPVQGGR